MRHVLTHDSIDTRSHTPAHTRLLEHTPPYNRSWALVFKKGTDDQHFHFRLSSGGHHHEEASPQAKRLLRILQCFRRRLLVVTHTVWETTITDDCDERWVRLPSPTRSSMARTMHNGSVSNGSGPSLQVRVRVQPEPLLNRLSGLSINPNRQLGYGSIVNSQAVWIGLVVSGSHSGSIHWFNEGSCFWSMWIVSYQNRVFNNQGYVFACFAACNPD